jgi:hypothetical protein
MTGLDHPPAELVEAHPDLVQCSDVVGLATLSGDHERLGRRHRHVEHARRLFVSFQQLREVGRDPFPLGGPTNLALVGIGGIVAIA